MRSHYTLPLVAAFVAFTPVVYGQSLLDKLERQIPAPAAGAAATPAPGTGHLGAVPFDDDPMFRGVRVKEVRPGGPADLGGLKPGDVITAIDAKAVTRLADLDAVLDKSVPNQRLRLMVERAGKQQSLNILLGVKPESPPALEPAPADAPPTPAPSLTTPGAAASPAPAADPLLAPPSSTPITPGAPPLVVPDPAPSTTLDPPAPIRSRPSGPTSPLLEPAPAENPLAQPSPSDALPAPGAGGGASLGVSVLPLTEEARATYGLTVRRGAFIAGLRPGSPAERAGLPIGGVIVALNGRRIDSADDLVAFISTAQAGQEVELAYYEGSRLSRKTVRLAPASQPTPSTMTPAPAPRSGPLGLSGAGGADRPLLGRVERMVEGLSVPRAPSTVYNPADMAALQARMQEIADQLRAMDERLRALEGRGGISPTPSSPSSPFAPPGTAP